MRLRSLVRDFLYRQCPRTTFALHSWWYWLRAVEPEIRLVPQLCIAGTCSLDIGAHFGIYSYFMRRHSAAVISFEPNPVLAARLRSILGSRSDVRESALSNETGTALLTIPRRGNDSLTALATIDAGNLAASSVPHDVRSVQTARLDDFLPDLPRVGFIKIDVEGHELSVLQGACGLLARDKPAVLVEAEERHRKNAVSSICAFLRPLGYEGYFHHARRLIPIDQFAMTDHQHIIAARKHSYINNFIFVASSEARQRIGQ